MSTAYLARWSGPVLAGQDPYSATSTTSATFPPAVHVQQVIWLPIRSSATDNSAIKQAVMTYGAVAISLDYEDPDFNSTTSAYYMEMTILPILRTIMRWMWWDGMIITPPAISKPVHGLRGTAPSSRAIAGVKVGVLPGIFTSPIMTPALLTRM